MLFSNTSSNWRSNKCETNTCSRTNHFDGFEILFGKFSYWSVDVTTTPEPPFPLNVWVTSKLVTINHQLRISCRHQQHQYNHKKYPLSSWDGNVVVAAAAAGVLKMKRIRKPYEWDATVCHRKGVKWPIVRRHAYTFVSLGNRPFFFTLFPFRFVSCSSFWSYLDILTLVWW